MATWQHCLTFILIREVIEMYYQLAFQILTSHSSAVIVMLWITRIMKGRTSEQQCFYMVRPSAGNIPPALV